MKINKMNLSAISCLFLLAPLASEAASHRKIVYIDQYDQDLDGKVSSIEFEQSRRARFDITDANSDGVVSAEEYVFEWEDRLDQQLAFDRNEQVLQTATRFDSLNDNENNLISWEEFEASGLWSFNRFDSNDDGKIDEDDVDSMAEEISQSERELTREQILHDNRRMLVMPSTHNKAGTLEQYDANDDGVATTAEFTTGRQGFFAAMDENGDGGINADEYLAEFENRMDAEISRYRKDSVEQAYVRFEVLDANESAEMTFEEYQASGHSSFVRWDTDDNGYVSLEEADPVAREHNQEDEQSES